MKELPYFKFHVSEWINGDITLEPLEEQGAFINICAYYWFKDGQLKLAEAKRRLTEIKPTAFQSLIKKGFLKVENDFLHISFLDQQLDARNKTVVINTINGKKGGRPKVTQKKPTAFISETQPEPKQKPIREEEEKNKKEIQTLSNAVFQFLGRRGSNTMDVTYMVQQWVEDGHTDIMNQLKAMRAAYDHKGLVFPTKIETLTQSFSMTDWIQQLKDLDPERKAERIQKTINDGKHKPQPDTIGSSTPGSLG